MLEKGSINMDKDIQQIDIARCKQHPDRFICFIFCKSNCPYRSHLACNKCVKEYNTFNGFEDMLDVLTEPRIVLKHIDQPKGIYDLLNEYFNLLEQDQDAFIRTFKEDIAKQIQKLEQDLKDVQEKYKKFREEITKAKQQFNEALALQQFRQAFKDIVKVDNYHQSQDWVKFEKRMQSFMLQFENQSNQELNATCYKLIQMEQPFLQPNLLSNFRSGISLNLVQLSNRLGFTPILTSLCDPLYFYELINRISDKKKKPQLQLIFKATQDGMNSYAFWQKCNNQGPTLIFCKSKNGHIFGGYTPCKWIPNGNFQKDTSKTSFLFSYTRKEIYPILTDEKAIYGYPNNGPYFGGSPTFYINGDFQSGSSHLNGQGYSVEKYKIDNQKAHLMGGEQPNLVEMEVFLIQ